MEPSGSFFFTYLHRAIRTVSNFPAYFGEIAHITKVKTPFHIFGAMKNPPKHKFFLVFDHYANFNEANKFLIGGVRSGELKYKEMIVDGLEKAPEYFKRLFTGSNFGKLIVKVADQ